jgi:hypothetical protein
MATKLYIAVERVNPYILREHSVDSLSWQFSSICSFCPHSVVLESTQLLTQTSTMIFPWWQSAAGAWGWQLCLAGYAECQSNDGSPTSRLPPESQGRAMAQAVSRRPPTAELWDLWWTKWHWDRFFPDYFGFPLSISFHRCSITRKRTKGPPQPWWLVTGKLYLLHFF